MAEAAPAEEDVPKKKSKKPLLLGVVLMLALGGGGFYATWSGMILGDGHAKDAHAGASDHAAPLPEIAFVPVDPVVISLGSAPSRQHLRFTAQLEVTKPAIAEVTLLLPRILDVMNGYLRALDVAELEDPAAMIRIRAHILRRVQMVTGETRVRDLLITEFVLN